MYRNLATVAVLAAGLGFGAPCLKADGPKRGGAVAELLEDNAEALLKLLTNPTGDPGEGHVGRSANGTPRESPGRRCKSPRQWARADPES